MATFIAATKFTAIDKFSSPIRRMSSNVRKFGQRAETSIARADRAFRRMTPGIGSATKQFLSFASAAVVATAVMGLIAMSGGVITQFETGLVGVGKTTGIAGAELKQLGREIVEASNKLRTIKSSKLLELAEAAGQLGVTGSDNIIKFATTLAKLEKASDIVGEKGAKSIARLLTITKEGVGIVDRFSATLVALGNASAASESEILGVASEVGRATAAYSLNSRTILGIAAALKSLDVAPEAAGSAIGKVFRGIELATIKGGETLRRFGKIMQLTPKQVRETFKKAPEEAFKLFVKGLGRIKEEGGSLAKSLIDVGLSGERISKGIIPLATNFELLEGKLKLAEKAFRENTALEEEFAAAQKTVTSAVNSISRAWENLVIKTATAGSSLESIQKVLFFVSDNLATIVKWLGISIGLWLAVKILISAAKVGLAAYNIVLGISTALQGKSAISLRRSKIALKAYAFASRIVTAAQWLWNAAMLANPIGLIIIGIVALIALIAVIVNKWNSWGAALSLFLGPIGLIISMVQSFRRNWDLIVSTFKTEGILAGFKKIGATILDAILMPLQQVFELIAKLTGADFAVSAAAEIAQFREKLGVNVTTDETGKEIIQPGVSLEQARTERFETTENQNIGITIKDETGRAEVNEGKGPIAVVMEPTFIFP